MAESNLDARKAAMQCLKDGDLERAIELASNGLAEAPSDASLLMVRGVAQMQAGDWEAGVADLRAAAVLNPGDAKVQFNLGNGLAKLGERDEASRAYQAALAAEPGYEPARNALEKIDPDALGGLDAVPPIAAPLAAAPSPPPAAPPPPALAADVVLGLDGEPMAGVTATPPPSFETPVGGTSPGLGYGRQPSRPSYMPGEVGFVRTWFWVMWGVTLLFTLGFGGCTAMSVGVAGKAAGEGFANLPPEVLAEMSPEERQQLQDLQKMGVTPDAVAQSAKMGMGVLIIGLAGSLFVSLVLTLLVAKGLGDGASWGYWLAMVLSVLGLLSFPFTIGYIFAIVNLAKPVSKAWCGVA